MDLVLFYFGHQTLLNVNVFLCKRFNIFFFKFVMYDVKLCMSFNELKSYLNLYENFLYFMIKNRTF